MDTTTSVLVEILKLVGLPGFIVWLWSQDRRSQNESLGTSLNGMATAVNLLAEKVGEATEAARGNK